MKLSAAFLATTAVSGSLTDGTLKYPVKNANIPDIGRAHRIKSGNDLSLPVITPSEGESTYVVFANNFRQALKIKKSRDACEYNPESADCQKDLKLAANVVFKITPDAFKSGSIGFPSVPEDQAIFDRENDAVIIKNSDFSHGGFWWSIHGSNQVNMTDITFSHDKMSMIQVVNDCHVKAGWDEEINFNQYGWHKGGDGKLSFNEAGFRAGDVFASCSFDSSPPSLLKWDSDYVADGASLGKVDAKVPAHRLLADSITCSVEEFERGWDNDECKEDFESSIMDVMAPPSILDYTYSDENTSPVWRYVNRLDETDIAPISFTCPFLESADSVTVVSQNFVSKNLIGGDMAAVPMAVEAEDLVFGGLEETSNGKQFVLSIRKEHLEPGAQEFRCEYGAGDQILGFSKPFILNVFDEESESDLEEPVIQWGDMVKQTKLIKQGEKVTNIAVCYQKATGSPSGLQFGFNDANGVKTHYTYPAQPAHQHAISLNMQPIGITDKAGIFCTSTKEVNGETKSVQVDLGDIEIIRKPRSLATVGLKDKQQQWTVDCRAEVSSHDNVLAALSINKNHKLKVIDGFATFNITGEFTEREQEKFKEKGTKCVYTSEQFPDEKFEANFWHITVMRPAGREEGGWPWGFLLMLGGLACMLSMCFGWNKPEPVKSDEEAPMLK